jgi:hypothetical protein
MPHRCLAFLRKALKRPIIDAASTSHASHAKTRVNDDARHRSAVTCVKAMMCVTESRCDAMTRVNNAARHKSRNVLQQGNMFHISVTQRRASRSHVRCDDARQCVLLQDKNVIIVETMTCVISQ